MLSTLVNSDTSISFVCEAPYAHSVTVSGNFNDWQQWDMNSGSDGRWYLTTPALGQGEVEYKFVVDGQYTNDQSMLVVNANDNSCLSTDGNKGTLIHTSFYSKSLDENKKYVIYLPPSYSLSDQVYPVLYLSGGLLDWERSWHDKANISQVADSLIAQNDMKEMVVVMPDKSQAWTEENQGHLYYNYIANDLITYIEQNYRVRSDQKGRAIEGLSIGAHWALKIAFDHPNAFTSVSALSCPVSGDLFDLASDNKQAIIDSGIRIRLNCGDEEPQIIPANMEFEKYLKDLGVTCECYVGSGPHDWPLWEKEIINSLKFHSYAFEV
ncbi:alpha/beta hydrolase-fold protein [bacterium]|nr:alpha/beta hydrolase-fold protein [bacterium]